MILVLESLAIENAIWFLILEQIWMEFSPSNRTYRLHPYSNLMYNMGIHYPAAMGWCEER